MTDIKPAKACEEDSITARLLQDCGDCIVASLMHIINLSLATSCFLWQWKTSLVSPLYKEGARDNPGNYRLKSLLSLMIKVLEKVAHNQLYSYLRETSYQCENQSGFRKGYSTDSCHLNFLDGIYADVDEGLPIKYSSWT